MEQRVFSVADYGAVTCDSLMTEAFQTAIDACFLAGGGEVTVPAGVYRIGDIRLRSGVTLHLLTGAILEGSEDPEDYGHFMRDTLEPVPQPLPEGTARSADPSSRWCHGLIRAYKASNIGVTGDPGSFIDGRNVYDASGEENYRGPHGITFWDCDGIALQGYTIRNTGNWAHAIFRCRDIRVSGIAVYAGHDGLDVFLCEHVTAENCVFKTGDDCLAGFGSRDVTLRGCVLDSACSAVRFGGTDVLIEKCTTRGPAPYAHRYSLNAEMKAGGAMTTAAQRHNTLTAFLYYCDARFGALPYEPGSITVRDCVFESVDQLFNMDFGRHKWCCNAPLRSITFERCRLTGAMQPVYIHGDAEKQIRFTMKDVTVARAGNAYLGDVFLDAENASELTLENVRLEGFAEAELILRSETALERRGGSDLTVKFGEAGAAEFSGH